MNLLILLITCISYVSLSKIIIIDGPIHNNKQILPQYMYNSNKIDGVYIRLLWNEIESVKNIYNFNVLNSVFDRITYANKYRNNDLIISLSIRSGNNTPQWIKNSIPSYNFTVSPHNGYNNSCYNISLPQPWNIYLINRYKLLINKLYNFISNYNSVSNLIKITYIKLSLINEITEELRLPSLNHEIKYNNCVLSNAAKIWNESGYSNNLIFKTWKNINTYVMKKFNESIYSVEILNDYAFPNDAENNLTKKIINYLLKNCNHSLFAIQWDGFNSIQQSQLVLNSYKMGAMIGWQMNEFMGPYLGTGCNGNTIKTCSLCTKESYNSLFKLSNLTHASYIEIWNVNYNLL